MKTCKDIMTKNPCCLSADETVQRAAAQMLEEDIGTVLVCEPSTERLLGIVTDRDIAIKLVAPCLKADTPLKTIMTQAPLYCLESDSVDRALDLMTEHQVRRIPVVDGDQHLVGIISQGDIATRMREVQKTADMVEKVSRPPSSTYRGEHLEGELNRL